MLLMNDIYKILTISDEPPTLYELMESKVNYNNPNPVPVDKLPEAFRQYLFDFNYPLDSAYRETFETLFLKHYMFRRIGFETYTSFKLHLEVKLYEIMPKYNKMFEGFYKLDFDGSKELHTKATEEIGSSSSNNTNDNRFSNLPQNEIQDVRNGSYMTDYTYNQGNATSQANRNESETININRGDSLDEYKKFIENTNNIYEDIFKECDSLFFGVV